MWTTWDNKISYDTMEKIVLSVESEIIFVIPLPSFFKGKMVFWYPKP